MDWSVVLVIGAVFLAVAALPTVGRPARWRVRLARLLERLARRLRHRRGVPHDPFEVLRVQMRLSIVADQVRALEDNPHVYAKAHRLKATRAAYDDLLEEACRLAGVPVDPHARRSETERLREEVELSSRGWSW